MTAQTRCEEQITYGEPPSQSKKPHIRMGWHYINAILVQDVSMYFF
jgi:hypothetical protein